MDMDWGFDPDAPIESTRSIQTPYGEQDENGVDLSLIREALQLTPLERIRKAAEGCRGALILMEYGRLQREKSARESHRAAG
jgi:hypothetical protein